MARDDEVPHKDIAKLMRVKSAAVRDLLHKTKKDPSYIRKRQLKKDSKEQKLDATKVYFNELAKQGKRPGSVVKIAG